MTRPRTRLATAALAALLVLAGWTAARADCDHGLPKLGYLGIADMSCNCSTQFEMKYEDSKAVLRRTWTFRSEPVVRGLNPSGPSAGRLREGDVITAVDGMLITTREGSDRFSHIVPGQRLSLTVRRDEREVQVPITVGSICPEELGGAFSVREMMAPEAATTPESPSPETAPRAPRAPRPRVGPPPPGGPVPRTFWIDGSAAARPPMAPNASPEALPRGWLGIGINCQDCGGELPDGAEVPVWSFGTLPMVSFVDPEGPAASAGLRRGDQITHIDGISLLTPEGGKRFGAVQRGQAVKWTLVRDGATRVVSMTAAERPGDRSMALEALRERLRALRERRGEAGLAAELRSLEQMMESMDHSRRHPAAESRSKRLRYAGSVAGSDVEVRGLGNVVVDDSGDEIVITTRDATIRIRPGAGEGKAPQPKPQK